MGKMVFTILGAVAELVMFFVKRANFHKPSG